jgi:uncharacterized glyoxalase superfamily protein PhnB
MTYKPDGYNTITPRIFTPEPEQLVAFLWHVFDATGAYQPNVPAEIRIGDSMLLVSDGGGVRDAMPACLYIYVPDTDATHQRALATNATSVEAPLDTPYGDRRAVFLDPWNNMYQVATRKTSR